MEPKNVSDRIKKYLDDPQWPELIKDPLIEENQETNLFKFITIHGNFSS